MYARFLRENNLTEGRNIIVVPFGSRVYGTERVDSDYDYIGVTRPGQFRPQNVIFGEHRYENFDITVYHWNIFTNLLGENEIHATEAFFHPKRELDEICKFKLNLPSLRKQVSGKASNSWVKAKKKTQQGDFLLGQKSLFHSLRILNFGTQIAEFGKIRDFHAANKYWTKIQSIANQNSDLLDDWTIFGLTFKKEYNRLATEFRKLAPKA